MRAIALGILVLLAGAAGAADPGRSIMFQNQGEDYRHLTTVPADAGAAGAANCSEMARQLEALKGKPQRRYALAQRYRLECQRSGAHAGGSE